MSASLSMHGICWMHWELQNGFIASTRSPRTEFLNSVLSRSSGRRLQLCWAPGNIVWQSRGAQGYESRKLDPSLSQEFIYKRDYPS